MSDKGTIQHLCVVQVRTTVLHLSLSISVHNNAFHKGCHSTYTLYNMVVLQMQEAEIQFLKEQNELEINKAKELSEIEVSCIS